MTVTDSQPSFARSCTQRSVDDHEPVETSAMLEDDKRQIDAVDAVLKLIFESMIRLEKAKNSMVKRRGAEADFLKQVEMARDILQVALQGDKMRLNKVYGGQCVRIGKLRYMLETVQLSAMYANDQRWKHIEERVESVEAILRDLGTYKEWVPQASSLEEVMRMGSERTSPEVHKKQKARVRASLTGVWDTEMDMKLDSNGCFQTHDGPVSIRQNGDEVQIYVGDELRGKGWFDDEKNTFVGTLNGERISGTVDADGQLVLTNGMKWAKRPANIIGAWDKPSTETEGHVRFMISQSGNVVTAREEGSDELPFVGEIDSDGIKLTRKCTVLGDETKQVLRGKFDKAKKSIIWDDNSTWCMHAEPGEAELLGDDGKALPSMEGVWDDITKITVDFWSCLREEDDGIRVVQNGNDMEFYGTDEELCGKASYDANQKKVLGTLKEKDVSATIEGDERMKFADGKMWAKRPVDIAGPWHTSQDSGDSLIVCISQKGPVISAVSQDDEELLEFIGEVTSNTIKFTRKGTSKAGEAENTMTGKFDEATKQIVWADNTTWLKGPKSGSASELDVAVPTPSLAGVWDDVTDCGQDCGGALPGNKAGVRVIQDGDDAEIFVAGKLCGKVSYDKKKKQFVGLFNDEEVVATIGEDGNFALSNGKKWAQRPVNIVGTWDRCPTADDSAALRLTLTQIGAKVIATAEDDPEFELTGEVTANGIKFTREASPENGVEAEVMTGQFDDTEKNIIWADDSLWLKRPEVDVEGVWDEVPGTGCATYHKGMVLHMVGPKVSCDHVTLSGEGTVTDDSALIFRFDKRGENSGKFKIETDAVITWADGTQWRRRKEIVTDLPNNMEGSDVSSWRRKHSFGPLRHSCYLDSVQGDVQNFKENEVCTPPDLFTENKKSSNQTQRAFTKAFGSFCERLGASSLEEVMAQPGPGITMPQNWMVWMVHRVWLNDPTVTTLSFANMEMPDPQVERNVGPKLMEALKHNTYLEHLELQNTNLPSGDIIQMLGQAIIENTTLKSINLQGNTIDAAGLMALADALTKNKALEVLKVQHQKTRSSGVQVEQHFSEALDENNTLTKLGIELKNPHHRDQIGRKLMRNMEIKRRTRLALARSSSNI